MRRWKGQHKQLWPGIPGIAAIEISVAVKAEANAAKAKALEAAE